MSLQEPQMQEQPQGAGGEQPKVVEARTPTQLAMRRFRKDKLSMAAFIVVAFFVVAGLLAPLLVKLGFIDPFTFHKNLVDPSTGGIPRGDYGGISAAHPLGVEPGTGRDVLSRLWFGITFSMAIALTATVLATGIGTVLGIISGFSRGWADAVIGRLVDLTLSFPQTLMLLALSTPLIIFLQDTLHFPDNNFTPGAYVVLVLAVFGWPAVCRLIRGQVLSIREREFIDAAELMGSSRWRLYFKEILPNLWAPLLVNFTLMMPQYVSAEAALSYLGVGISAPTPTLGNILRTSITYLDADFVFFFTPAFLIALIVVSFNLLGDGLRDALDPKADR